MSASDGAMRSMRLGIAAQVMPALVATQYHSDGVAARALKYADDLIALEEKTATKPSKIATPSLFPRCESVGPDGRRCERHAMHQGPHEAGTT